MTAQAPYDAIDLRPPYRLAAGTVVVLTGPDRALRGAVHDKAWRASIGLAHGTHPLFVPRPLFVDYDELPSLDPAALAGAQGCLWINGWRWDHTDAAAPRNLIPSLIVVATSEVGSGIPSYLRDIASHDSPVIHAVGHSGQVGETLYSEMFSRGLMRPRLIGERR